MSIKNPYTDLTIISQYLGKNPNYAQGGGGNTSVKKDNNSMLIKASGFKLADVSKKEGYVVINQKKYLHLLNEKLNNLSEDDYTKIGIESLIEATHLKPSIETCFHACIRNTHVIHSHSIFTNILSCSAEGESITKKLFPNSIFIEYATPGKALALKIFKSTEGLDHRNLIIFLQNHGVIIGSQSAKECLDTHEELNRSIREKFSLHEGIESTTLDSLSNVPILFPDQVVYSSNNTKTQAAIETLKAAKYIFNQIERNGLTPIFLPNEERDFLLNMESEKYRQRMANNE